MKAQPTLPLLRAQRELRIARIDLYLAKAKLVRAIREVEGLVYPPPPALTRKQAG